jgi:radical SAM superfamily enzyme YgiQ (UPF0313 family)
VCGGAHPTFYPEVINDEYLDIACVGEGEAALAQLAETLERGRDPRGIKNLIVKKDGGVFRNELRPLVDDLDTLPFADRTIYYKYAFFRDQRHAHMITSRGCPFQCSFCFNILYNEMYRGRGTVIRRRGVGNVIEELKDLKRDNPALRHIFFLDDTFVLSGEWTSEFLEAYKERIDLPFSCTARASLVTEELIRKMKDARCFSIRLGVESADANLRNNVLKKGITADEILRAATLIKNHGIRLLLYNMVGSPGETLDMALGTFELNRRLRPTYAWCSLLQPYPGTEIFEYAKKGNYLIEGHSFEKMGNSYFMTSPIKMESPREMRNLQKIFALGVFLNLPARLVRLLIKLPLEKIYGLVFQAAYALGISKMDKISLAQLARTAVFSKNYFKGI